MSEWIEEMPDDDALEREDRRSEFRLNRAVRAYAGGQNLYIVNLSASGFRGSLAGPLPDAPFPLEIVLPQTTLAVRARPVWSLGPDYAGLTDAGFTFVDLEPIAREALLEFLRSEVASSRGHDAPDPEPVLPPAPDGL